MIGMLGKKICMDSIFLNNKIIPVTIIDINNNYLFNSNKNLKKTTILLNCYLKIKNFNNVKKFYKYYGRLFEFNFYNNKNKVGDLINFKNNYLNDMKINISSYSIGKGFSGVIKKHNFSSGDASHGNTKSHRKPGSIGMRQDPGKVFKGKKMPGRLGGKKITIKNIKIIYNFNNLLYIKGSIPGKKNSIIKIYKYDK
ncbi:50S ribosomal protein L3 [Candidatus Vidania fulgoroideorum]